MKKKIIVELARGFSKESIVMTTPGSLAGSVQMWQ